MNRKQKIIVSITGIFIVLLALVGLTYAYFLTRIRGNEEPKSISVTTANLELTYGDGEGIITATNIVPDQEIDVKDFTVTNNGNATVTNYKVYLENVQNQFELKEDVTYTLTCKSYKTTNTNVDFSTLAENGTCTGADKTTFPSVMSVIATNSIEVGYTHRYELKVEYAETGENQSVDMGKLLQAKINIYDEKSKFLVTEIINNAQVNATNNSTTGTLYTLPENLVNKPAEAISGANEKQLSYTYDDLGTSYYYRGSVEDNYVNFAGMCWRIVRIEGDGSVKLILEDQDNDCKTSDGNWNIPTTTDGDTLKGNFGYDETKYANKVIMNYLNPSANSVSTSMSTAFKNFQIGELSNYIDDLKSGGWCLADDAYLSHSVDLSATPPLTDEEREAEYNKGTLTEVGPPGSGMLEWVNGSNMVYNSYIRLMTSATNTTKMPTLKCNGTIMDKYGDNTTGMYVGTLTADEVVYAGVTASYNVNNSYYLKNNNSSHWWTLTPYFFHGLFARDTAFVVFSYGYVNYDGTGDVNASNSFRPAVSLKSSIMITGGNGTSTNPFIVASAS